MRRSTNWNFYSGIAYGGYQRNRVSTHPRLRSRPDAWAFHKHGSELWYGARLRGATWNSKAPNHSGLAPNRTQDRIYESIDLATLQRWSPTLGACVVAHVALCGKQPSWNFPRAVRSTAHRTGSRFQTSLQHPGDRWPIHCARRRGMDRGGFWNRAKPFPKLEIQTITHFLFNSNYLQLNHSSLNEILIFIIIISLLLNQLNQ